MKLDLPAAINPAQVAALLPGVSPPGTTVEPKRNGWLLRQGNRILRIRLEKGGTRVRFTMETPGWAYAFILLGILPFIIAVFVFDAAVKGYATEVRARLGGALGLPGYPATPLSPCPFCHNLVQVTLNHEGQRLCSVCANTGQPIALPARGMSAGLVVGIVLGSLAAIIVLSAVVFVLVTNLGGPQVFSEATETVPPYTAMTIDLPMTQSDRREVTYTFTATNGKPVTAGFYRVDPPTGKADASTGVAITRESLTGTGTSLLGGPDWGFVVSCDQPEPCIVHYKVEWTRSRAT